MVGNCKSSKKAINSLILVLLWILFSSAQSQKNWRTCVIVIDGDTILLDGNEIVRLIGIDTPETKDPRKPVQYYGREAYEFTKRLVEGKKVRLAYDLSKKDKYGRTLAYVYLEDSTFLNAEIIKQGYGFAYRHFLFKYFDEFEQHEIEARENEIGLWSDGGGEESQVARKNDSDIVYITRTGKKYHREGCGSLRRSKIPIFLYEACKRRYAPCSKCNPPECKMGISGWTHKKVKILTPFSNKNKSEIIKMGTKLGVPFKYTWSCGVNGEEHCGKCIDCVARKKAFVDAGVKDPKLYKHK